MSPFFLTGDKCLRLLGVRVGVKTAKAKKEMLAGKTHGPNVPPEHKIMSADESEEQDVSW